MVHYRTTLNIEITETVQFGLVVGRKRKQTKTCSTQTVIVTTSSSSLSLFCSSFRFTSSPLLPTNVYMSHYSNSNFLQFSSVDTKTKPSQPHCANTNIKSMNQTPHYIHNLKWLYLTFPVEIWIKCIYACII